MFNKISIIGCGLIGSSILRAIVEKKLASKISAYDKSSKVIDYLKKNFSIEVCNNISNVVKDSDLVIIASPLSSYKEILLSIQSNLKENVILTDTGSAKKEVNKIISNLNLKNVNWIASHPIAGTEYSGPEAGFATLFNNRWCILSADNKVSKDKINELEKFWSNLGSKVKSMSFEDHDYILSLTSHLPHAVAYSIVKTAINNDDKFKDDISIVGINSNDSVKYPDDDFESMKAIAKEKGLKIDYLVDETQEIAKKYGAVCTPDPFLFDSDKKLIFHGRIDDAMSPEAEVSEKVMINNIQKFLEGQKIEKDFDPSIGCSIKWKEQQT